MFNLDNLKDEIKIPKDIDLAIKKGIERGRKECKMKSPQKRYKKFAALAAVIAITITVGIFNPGIVKALPGIKSIFKLINYNNVGESFDKFEAFSTSVNKTVTKDGITVTIDKIVIDDNTFAVTSIIQGKNIKANQGDMGHIKLNGKSLSAYGSTDKKIDDNRIVRVTSSNISDMKLSNDVNVDLNIVWIGNVKGPWNFKFKVSKSEKPTNSRCISLNNKIKLPDSTLKIKNLVISPLGNSINYSGVYDKLNENMINSIFDFIVMDDKGKVLETDLGSGTNGKKDYNGTIEVLNDLSNVKSLTVIPILKRWGVKTKEINKFPYSVLQTTINSTNFNIPQEIMTKSRPVTAKEKSDGYAFDNVIHVFNIDKDRQFSTIDKLVNQVIKVGQNSSAVITKIETTAKYTKVTFKLQGNGVYPYKNINDTVIVDENYKDIERAEDGPIAILENVEERIVSIKLPPIDKSKKYKIALPIIDEPKIENQYKINIDLDKQ
ncbi:DUF4179 domain-containing protein [Clostridium autoethanogenum]|uniref:DUF4179 domain-containing protein n=1 Tax=Clostridium autoethanogenum DSM 10061 TaxID=1341692 RepID=A0ABM5NZG3_9CLOT|nr:DUF4179 domain-containing protein [Clostridium autoethanogenum]AGY77917.1 DUF4179 domain-containing protein [Clostridium autoethanogenum DSM 10061]ALU38050.1 hypothetical protein CLAU_3623 [Clostridium autoethanogenum DSM 10061]OVY50814.1 hypothetical protein WX72_01975 [Clostridium autoethanogenum]